MQQQTGRALTTTTCSSDSGTGPDAKASTGVEMCGFDTSAGSDCSAAVTLHITHNQVIATAQLNMGSSPKVAQCVLERRRGSASGWVMVRGSDFEDERSWISPELAAFAASLPFPYAVANMLPGTRASAAAVAMAAQEVANG